MTRLRRSAAVFFLSQVLFASVAKTEQVRVLARPEDAYSQFVTLITQARTSIDLATFIFEPCDPSTQIIMESLAARARAGVKVRVLLDAISQSSRQRRNIADSFARYGIPLRLYSAAISPTLNLRMHTKMMVVDGRAYIAGGRNLSDAYFGLSAEYNFVDEDLYVAGPAAAQAAAAFEELWIAPMSSDVGGSARTFKEWSSFCDKDPGPRVGELRAFFRQRAPLLLENLPTYQCARVNFHADSPHFSNAKFGPSFNKEAPEAFMNVKRLAQKRASGAVLAFLDGTRSRLEIQNWVYIPTGRLSDSFAALRSRGISVQVATNADIESGPELFREIMEYSILKYSTRDTTGTQKVRRVSSQGALTDDFELTPDESTFYIHAKTMVRDQKDVIVGSFNLDSRSYNTNLEAVTIVNGCAGLAASVQSDITMLKKIYQSDIENDRIPLKREASPLAKLLAALNVSLL